MVGNTLSRVILVTSALYLGLLPSLTGGLTGGLTAGLTGGLTGGLTEGLTGRGGRPGVD